MDKTSRSGIDLFDPPQSGDRRPFSRVARAGGVIYVSGHTAPHDPAKGVHRGADAGEETRNALAYIRSLLVEAGSDLDRVVQVTMLITDPADYDACNLAYREAFPENPPARHTARFGVPTEARVGFACIALA